MARSFGRAMVINEVAVFALSKCMLIVYVSNKQICITQRREYGYYFCFLFRAEYIILFQTVIIVNKNIIEIINLIL